MTTTILPRHHSPLQRALELAMRPQVDVGIIPQTLSIAASDPRFLPLFAYQRAIETAAGWQFAEDDATRRELLQQAWTLHRYRGTPYAIRALFRQLGIGEIDLIENIGLAQRNGQVRRDGTYIRGGDKASVWATYKIRLHSLITLDQADLILTLLDHLAPRRSQLISMDFKTAAARRNRKVLRNGQYTRGEISS